MCVQRCPLAEPLELFEPVEPVEPLDPSPEFADAELPLAGAVL
jgi:hypothetical protein